MPALDLAVEPVLEDPDREDLPKERKSPLPTKSSLVVGLLIVAFIAIQALIGGAKLVYSLPTYCVFGLAAIACLLPSKRQHWTKPFLFCLVTAGALAAYVLGRAWFSPVEYIARTDFMMVLGAIVVYLITAVHLTQSQHRIAVLGSFFAFALLHILVGAVQFKLGNNYMLLPWIFRPDYEARASGFYICPNHLAGLLEMLALMALSLCCWGRGKLWIRMTWGYCAIGCLAGVAVTGSRGGYISTAVGLAVFVAISLMVFKRLRKREFNTVAAFAVLGTILVLGVSALLIQRSGMLNKRLSTVYDPGNMRVHLWTASLKQWKLSPVVGTGAGTYVYYGRHFRDPSVQNDPVHVHNDYLELLAEYGAVGLGVFAVFFGIHLNAGFRGINRVVGLKLKPKKKRHSNEMALTIGVLAALGALTVHSIMDFNLHIPANTLFVAFLFGMLANPTSAVPKKEQDAPGTPLWLRLSVPAAGIALVAMAAPQIQAEYLGERSRVFLRDKMYPESIDYAKRALALEKKNADIYYYLGESHHHLAMIAQDPPEVKKLHEAAATAFNEGLKVFPQDLNLVLKLARTLDNLRRFDDATKMYAMALKLDPNFGNTYAFYGLHWHMQGKLKWAEALYRRALELGEKEVSPSGLADLEKDRQKPKVQENIFSDFISEPDVEEATDEGLAIPGLEGNVKFIPQTPE